MEKRACTSLLGRGKGKTTAAMGLALRALGHSLRVTVVQFLKDGRSGELTPLRELGAAVYSGMDAGFVFQMSGEEKASLREQQGLLLKKAMEEPCGLLILDEACAALQLGMVEDSLLRQAVLLRPEGMEVVITGREPAPGCWKRRTIPRKCAAAGIPTTGGPPPERAWNFKRTASGQWVPQG